MKTNSRQMIKTVKIFKKESFMGQMKECRGPELNWRHKAFQASALPTELPRHRSTKMKRYFNQESTCCQLLRGAQD